MKAVSGLSDIKNFTRLARLLSDRIADYRGIELQRVKEGQF